MNLGTRIALSAWAIAIFTGLFLFFCTEFQFQGTISRDAETFTSDEFRDFSKQALEHMTKDPGSNNILNVSFDSGKIEVSYALFNDGQLSYGTQESGMFRKEWVNSIAPILLLFSLLCIFVLMIANVH